MTTTIEPKKAAINNLIDYVSVKNKSAAIEFVERVETLMSSEVNDFLNFSNGAGKNLTLSLIDAVKNNKKDLILSNVYDLFVLHYKYSYQEKSLHFYNYYNLNSACNDKYSSEYTFPSPYNIIPTVSVSFFIPPDLAEKVSQEDLLYVFEKYLTKINSDDFKFCLDNDLIADFNINSFEKTNINNDKYINAIHLDISKKHRNFIRNFTNIDNNVKSVNSRLNGFMHQVIHEFLLDFLGLNNNNKKSVNNSSPPSSQDLPWLSDAKSSRDSQRQGYNSTDQANRNKNSF